MQELNLSGNELSSIEGLHRLHNLRKLTLTSNKITSLGGLEKLEALEHVLIQDNNISNIAELSSLAGALPHLPTSILCSVKKKLQFQRGANDICQLWVLKTFRTRLLAALPNLKGVYLKNIDGSTLHPQPDALNPGPETINPEP